MATSPPLTKETGFRKDSGEEEAKTTSPGTDSYPRPAGHDDTTNKEKDGDAHVKKEDQQQARKEDSKKDNSKNKTVFDSLKQPIMNKNPAINKAANIKQPSGKVMT